MVARERHDYLGCLDFLWGVGGRSAFVGVDHFTCVTFGSAVRVQDAPHLFCGVLRVCWMCLSARG